MVFWGLLVWGIYALITNSTRPPGRKEDGADVRRILDERLARGEIDAEEYRRLRDVISPDNPRTPDRFEGRGLPGLAGLRHGGGQIARWPEEPASQQRTAHCSAELHDPVRAGHRHVHVPPQHERKRRGWIEVGRDVAEEVNGHDEAQRRHQREHQHRLPRLQSQASVPDQDGRGAGEDEGQPGHPDEFRQQAPEPVVGVGPVGVASLPADGSDQGRLAGGLRTPRHSAGRPRLAACRRRVSGCPGHPPVGGHVMLSPRLRTGRPSRRGSGRAG